MKLKLLFFAMLILYSNSIIAQDYYAHKVVVKFKSNSTILNKWISNGRKGQIDELKKIIGENTSKSFLNNRILNGFKNRDKKSNQTQENSNSLERIVIVDYKSNIDSKIVASKLSKLSEVEYAEVKYINRINGSPNDSLFPQQYYLNQIKALEAWDLLNKDTTIIIAIVDTGVDYLHPDLSENIYTNKGEIGLDSIGNDKSKNGIDDDDNGFIDDWHGWDFKSSKDSTEEDNDPMAGATHGTHVAGIASAVTNNTIGIAGTGKNTKILAVKVGSDAVGDRSVYNEYDGVAYAGLLGARVMNCSWGTSGYSKSEQEIIDKVVSLGCVVVAAAGNDGKYLAFYPASYSGVMSVAAVNSKDEKAGFSNYYSAVDVSAPGVDIMSTLPNINYGNASGTSMASPVAAGAMGIIAQKFPNYSPEQLIEQLKAGCDNIDKTNPNYSGKLGIGRINIFNSLEKTNAIAANIINVSISDENNDNTYDKGEKVSLKFTIKNYLSKTENLYLKLIRDSTNTLKFNKDSVYIGNLNTLETKELSELVTFQIPLVAEVDSKIEIPIQLLNDTTILSKYFINITVNPSYRNFSANNIKTSVNSRGNIGYNDYPENTQGLGFQYKNFPNLMYEAGVIVGTGYDRVSDVTRANNQMVQNYKLYSTENISQNSDVNYLYGKTSFTDFSSYIVNNDSTVSNLLIKQKIVQPKLAESSNFIITYYDVVNNSKVDYDSLYLALFFDWDIGTSGDNNVIKFDDINKFGYVENVKDNKYPAIGVKMLSNHLLNFYAMENDGITDDNIGIHNGFSKKEKWFVISNGISKKETEQNDVSMIIGAGPIFIRSGDTTRIAFSIFAGDNKSTLASEAQKSKDYTISTNIAKGDPLPLPDNDEVLNLYPSEISNGEYLKIYIAVSDLKKIKIDLYNSIGQFISSAYNKMLSAGLHTIKIEINNINQGYYFAKVAIGDKIKSISYYITN
jgi:serine protease